MIDRSKCSLRNGQRSVQLKLIGGIHHHVTIQADSFLGCVTVDIYDVFLDLFCKVFLFCFGLVWF